MKWICDYLPPINLWNVWNMSDAASDFWQEEQMKLQQETAPHANHYRAVHPEPIEVIEGWQLGFNLGNAIKYIARREKKDTILSNLEKARWYLDREITLIRKSQEAALFKEKL